MGLLRLVACCAAEDLPLGLLLRPGLAAGDVDAVVGPLLVPLLEDELARDEAVAGLRRFSLISAPQGGLVSVHRLVQAITLDQLGATSKEDLSDLYTEFGTIHNGFGGRLYRYNYAATNEPGWFIFNGLVKHDTLTGRAERYQFEPGVFCSEVGVAPRFGGTEEDDAYPVTLTVDMNRDLSECVVFRANDVGRGPIARAQLPERIASGTHSCWAPGESIAGW